MMNAPQPLVDNQQDEGYSRARELLETMKQRRECFSSALDSSREASAGKLAGERTATTTTTSNADSNSTIVKPTAVKPPLFTPAESEAIALQLNNSLKERRARLSRIVSGQNEVSYSHPVSVGGGSKSSLCTLSTTDSTGGSTSPDYSSHQHEMDHSNSTLEHSIAGTSVPPTLEDIREAFAEMEASEQGESVVSDESSSSSSSSEEEHDNLRSQKAVGAMQLCDLDIPPTIIRSASSWDDSSSRQRQLPAVIPPKIRTVSSWDGSASSSSNGNSPRRFNASCRPRVIETTTTPTTGEVEAAAATSSSVDTSKSSGMPTTIRGASPSSSSLSTRVGRSAYIETMYSSTHNKGQELSYSAYIEPYSPKRSAKQTLPNNSSPNLGPGQGNLRSVTPLSHTSSLTSNSSLKQSPPRHSPANWRSPTPLNQSIPVGTRQDRYGYLQAVHAKVQRKQQQQQEQTHVQRKQPQEQRSPVRGASRRERPGNQIIPQEVPRAVSTTPSITSIDSDIMDLSVVVKDHAVHRKLVQSLQRNVNDLYRHDGASSPLTVEHFSDHDEIEISDESSFDCTTDSNTSGWLSDEISNKQHSLLEYHSDEDLTEVSLLTDMLPTASNRVQQSKSKQSAEPWWTTGQDPKPSKLKVEPILFVSEQVADETCSGSGGLYCIARLSGLSDQTPIHVKVVIKKPAARKGLRLSNDFRCGANGSHYDMALRSGLDLSQPCQHTAPTEGKEQVCAGGLYDLAIRSGLKDDIEARTPYSVTTTFNDEDNWDDSTVASERLTDYECGAAGSSLFFAMESGATYEATGSMFYVAERSGLTL